jgi:hypothetical protein
VAVSFEYGKEPSGTLKREGFLDFLDKVNHLSLIKKRSCLE